MNKMISTCCLASVALCLMSTAQSSIVSFDTNVVTDPIVKSIGNNSFDKNDTIYAFQENQHNGYLSHLIAFDPLTQQTIKTSITFGSDIVAVIHSSSGLKGSNSKFGATGIDYDIVKYSGLDNVGGGYDSYTVLGNTIKLNLRASDPGDYIRVITGLDGDTGATTGGPTIEDLLLGKKAEDDQTTLVQGEDFTLFGVEPDSAQPASLTVEGYERGEITTVGTTVGPDGFAERIPEPGTLALLGFGLGLAGLRRRPVSP